MARRNGTFLDRILDEGAPRLGGNCFGQTSVVIAAAGDGKGPHGAGPTMIDRSTGPGAE